MTRRARSAEPAEEPLPAPVIEGLDRVDQIKVHVWRGHRAAGFGHIDRGDFRARMALSLSALRKYAPAAFDHVCRDDREAQAVALQHGWLRDASAERGALGWDDSAGLERSVAAALPAGKLAAPLIAALRAGVERHAPDTVPAFDAMVARLTAGNEPEAPAGKYYGFAAMRAEVERAAKEFEATHGHLPGALTPEQLAAARQQAGIRQRPARPAPSLWGEDDE